MKHLGTRDLETSRLILRRFRPEDCQMMYTNWASDPEVTKYLTWAPHQSPDDSREYILSMVKGYEDDQKYDWGIQQKSTGELIGSIGVVKFDGQTANAHVGYCIGKQWWNQGFTTEAYREVIRFLLQDVGINRVESRFDPANVNSGKVMAACGLTYEGTHRQSDWSNQGIVDASWYAILREEFEAGIS